MRKKITLAYALLSALFFGYVLLRAILLDATYDEAWTIGQFVPLSVKDILFYNPAIANNHLINSLLIKWLFQYNDTLFVARLPNVLAFLVYAWYAIRLCREFFTTINGLGLFLLLMANPFLLDFFSLARGYGISLAACMAALYHYYHLVRNVNYWSGWKALVFAAFSVLSNFSYLYFYLALITVMVLMSFRLTWAIPIRNRFLRGSTLVSLSLMAMIYRPIAKLIEWKALWYGGEHNFYADTLSSLVRYSIGLHHSGEQVTIILNGLLLLFALVMGLHLLSEWRALLRTQMLSGPSLVLLLVTVAGLVLSFYLFGTRYLIDRTGLFFYVLFMIPLVAMTQELKHSFRRWIGGLIVGVVVCATCYNWGRQANLYTTVSWFHDAHTSHIMDRLNHEGSCRNRPVTMASSWPFRASIIYYKNFGHYPYVVYVEGGTVNLDSNKVDFYIHLEGSLPNVGYYGSSEHLHQYEGDTVMYFEKEGVVLLDQEDQKQDSALILITVNESN